MTCRHWREPGKTLHAIPDLGSCGRIGQDDGEPRAQIVQNLRLDGHATLYTAPDFGCAAWSARA